MRRICAAYVAYMRHIFPHISGIFPAYTVPLLLIVNTGNRLPSKIFKTKLDNKNAEKCDRICGNMWHMCDVYANFWICGICGISDFENAIIYGKICDMWVLGKIAITYSDITSIPT